MAAFLLAFLMVMAGLAPGFSRADEPQSALPDVLPGMDHAVPSDLAAKTLLLGAAHAGHNIVAVGQWGHVVLSSDEGTTWHQAKLVPTRETLTAVAFADDKNGWAVGHSATILGTTDGGETWTRQMLRPDLGGPLLSVRFADAKTGIAVGAYSMFFVTSDGGANWTQKQIVEGDLHYNDLFAAKDGTLFIAGEGGQVYRSPDQGRSWSKIDTKYAGSFWSGAALSDGTVLVAGMRGNIYRSTDDGKSWTAVKSGTEKSLAAIRQLQDGSVIAVGLGGTIIRSTDNGKSFDLYTRPQRLILSYVTDGPAGKILLFGEQGAQIQDLKVFHPGS